MNAPLVYRCPTCILTWSESYCQQCGKTLASAQPKAAPSSARLSSERRMVVELREAELHRLRVQAGGCGEDL